MKLVDLQFVHITKTGGTAIEEWGYANGVLWGKYVKPYYAKGSLLGSLWHYPSALIKNDVYKDKRTFTVVRNPYTRLVSEYHCPWVGSKTIETDTIIDFNNHVQAKILKRTNSVTAHLQSNYLPVDFILRHEHLQSDFSNLIHKVSDFSGSTLLPRVNLPVCKKFSVCDLNDNTIGMIKEAYKDDFETFGYDINL